MQRSTRQLTIFAYLLLSVEQKLLQPSCFVQAASQKEMEKFCKAELVERSGAGGVKVTATTTSKG